MKILILGLMELSAIFAVSFKANEWGKALQQIHVRAAKERNEDTSKWESQKMFLISKFGIIFSAFVLTAMIFSFIFGPIQL